ncbi:MAG: SDR family NAD(P)-dependent oxidoreductase [Verrucomicrobiota bacterium]
MKKILVTGSAGFIGNRVAQMLAESGHSVVGVDSINDAYDKSIKKHRLEAQAAFEALSFEHGDICDIEFLSELFRKHQFSAVLNLAARAGVRYSMENPSVYLQTNAQGTLNLLELMKTHGVEKMVLASTSSLYAGHALPFSEEMPVNAPISPYAASKKAAEAMVYAYHHLYGIDTTILRYFTVYGPAGRPDMCIFRFIKWIDESTPLEILGDGQQSRDFTYVDDIARGTIKAMRPLGFETINLGGGNEPVSLLKVIQILEELLGKKAVLKHIAVNPADMRETRAEVGKATRLLDWGAEVTLEEGLAASVDWYQANKDWVNGVQL